MDPLPSSNKTPFRKVPVEPIDCLKKSWNLIKGEYLLFLGITFVGMMISNVVPLVLMGPMFCGIYLCYLRKMQGESIKFELLFKGFDYFKDSFIAVLVMTGAIFAILMPLYLIMILGIFASLGLAAEEEAFGVIMFLVIGILCAVIFLLAILVGIFFLFIFLLIVDRKMTGWESVKLSARAAWANLWGLVGLFFLCTLLGFIGVLFCYIGAFLVMPVTFGAIAVAYRKIFPLSEEL